MKYSIIIPTYNNQEDLTDCLMSILKNSTLADTEIIVVSNGCEDINYIHGFKFVGRFNSTDGRTWSECVKILSFPDPVGYPAAINLGLMVAKGEYVVLMNNDCVILDHWEKDRWLREMVAPLESDHTVGVTGITKLNSKESGRHFAVFFLVMMRRKIFDELGMLDVAFSPGAGEDIDFCGKAERAGYRIVTVPKDTDEWKYETEFPIYHKAERTVHKLENWEAGFWERMRMVEARAKDGAYSGFADVTCEISTRGRYDTTLAWCMMSVAMQSVKPKRLIVYEDDGPVDFRDRPMYRHVLKMLDAAGIAWEVVFGEGKGQVRNHQLAIDMSKTEWIWRLDDDNFAEPDVLEKLLAAADEGTGAVAGSVITPDQEIQPGSVSNSIEHIYTHNNLQWEKGRGTVEVDHLYSTFIFRKSAARHGYDMRLSQVGHREETIFTHEMKRAGWKLLVRRDAVTWHMRDPQGGIRSGTKAEMWDRDEKIFASLMAGWRSGKMPKKPKWINLDCGIGDHYMFLSVFADIVAANPDEVITIAACYPSALESIAGTKNVRIVSVAEGILALGKDGFDRINIYAYCIRTGWGREPLAQAFKKLYS
jgi:GT2 family glycosyltransferase